MIYDNNFAVIDLETGGFSAEKNPITEIAIIFLDTNLEEIYRYESLVKNYNGLFYSPEAQKVTGIIPELLEKEGREIKDIVDELTEAFSMLKMGKYKKIQMVGHNFKSFDSPFLEYAFEFCEKNLYSVVDSFMWDTMCISRLKWGLDDTMKNHKLSTCCQKSGFNLVDAHRAMPDTEATMRLFKYFANCFRESTVIVKEEKKEERFRDTFEI